jgi:hypothetical protein
MPLGGGRFDGLGQASAHGFPSGPTYMAVENSVAASENKAKAHPAYRAYKYLERIDDLCDEFTKLIEIRGPDDG